MAGEQISVCDSVRIYCNFGILQINTRVVSLLKRQRVPIRLIIPSGETMALFVLLTEVFTETRGFLPISLPTANYC